jgi:G:T-mismatch repair DNA endonuclease (very short patch repair protein)
VTTSAETAGWRVLRVWECEVRHDVAGVAGRVLTHAHA